MTGGRREGRSDALVLFGVTGDLAYQKIFPALQAMVQRKFLEGPVVGVARSGWTREALLDRIHESLAEHGGVDQAAFERLKELFEYVDGDYLDPETFTRLRETIRDAESPLFYLAIPPSLFEPVIENLERAGCTKDARVVVEKPFGRDLESARELNAVLRRTFAEDAIFRIDHFLGREAVQNLAYFRFANRFLEPIWNREHVDRVEITMAESFGVKGRGRLYEELGAVRDVVQNHLLQVAALLLMEPPVGHEPEAIRDAKTQAFNAMRPIDPAEVIRGQFVGYRDENGVAPDSDVETFVALRLHVDSWRWADVPVYIRTGKMLKSTATEVFVALKRPPLSVFDDVAASPPNHVRFRLSPDVVIELGARAKRAGDTMAGESVDLDACRDAVNVTPAYQRLLGDAMRGDQMLFARTDNVTAAWRVVEPILEAHSAVIPYSAGSFGPPEAERLIPGGAWHDPE